MRTALAAALAVACAPRPLLDRSVSRGEPALARVDDVPVCGFPVQLALADDGGTVKGELLAVSSEAIFVADGSGLVAVSSEVVREVRVELEARSGAAMGALTALGALSTLSHGFYLVFTLPIWLGTGIPTSVNEGRAASASGAPTDPHLRDFARFPQGLPASWPPRGDEVQPCRKSAPRR